MTIPTHTSFLEFIWDAWSAIKRNDSFYTISEDFNTNKLPVYGKLFTIITSDGYDLGAYEPIQNITDNLKRLHYEGRDLGTKDQFLSNNILNETEINRWSLFVGRASFLVSYIYPLSIEESSLAQSTGLAESLMLQGNVELATQNFACEEISLRSVKITHEVYDAERTTQNVSCENIELTKVVITHNVYDTESTMQSISCEGVSLDQVVITHNVYDTEQTTQTITCEGIILNA